MEGKISFIKNKLFLEIQWNLYKIWTISFWKLLAHKHPQTLKKYNTIETPTPSFKHNFLIQLPKILTAIH